MAKRRRGRRSAALDQFAQDLGHILGTAQNKAESWLGQRQVIAKQLHQIRDSASQLLAKLGSEALESGESIVGAVMRRGRRGRPRGTGKKQGPGRPKGRKVSAAARRRMSLAAKRRWAARKAAEKKQEK